MSPGAVALLLVLVAAATVAGRVCPAPRNVLINGNGQQGVAHWRHQSGWGGLNLQFEAKAGLPPVYSAIAAWSIYHSQRTWRQTCPFDVSACVTKGGKCSIKFSAKLGGYRGDADRATLYFRLGGKEVARLGPVTKDDRHGLTKLMPLSGAVPVPVTADMRNLLVDMNIYRTAGHSADGYVREIIAQLSCECPPNYNPECTGCADGYEMAADGKTCARKCTVAGDCNGHALLASGNHLDSNCACSSCTHAWSGLKCNVCPSNYNPECTDCVAGYTKAADGMTCAPLCSVTTDCHHRAASVTGNTVDGNCVCSGCSDHWFGDDCNSCPANFDGFCAACTTGFEPTVDGAACAPKCDVAVACHGRAVSVSGNTVDDNCKCAGCTGRWFGDRCDECPGNHDPTCTACSFGHEWTADGKACAPVCTAVKDCFGNALVATGNEVDGCLCQGCTAHWSGSRCNECPPDFNANCTGCAEGYEFTTDLTQCAPKCDVTSDCRAGSASVTGNKVDGCHCTGCPGFHTGPHCHVCPADSNYNATCDGCVAGFVLAADDKTCAPQCTVADDCHGRAGAVTGNRLDGDCECTGCTGAWLGNDCGSCPVNYHASCDGCADGFAMASDGSTCAPRCTVAGACSGRAASVSGNTMDDNCKCAGCEGAWSGDLCDQCPPHYDATCVGCASGFEMAGDGKTCALPCTIVADCHGRAATVAGNSADDNCVCGGCSGAWFGEHCDECPANYNAECSACLSPTNELAADGHSCAPRCTVAGACSGRAASVSGNTMDDNCKCAGCEGAWSGDLCDQCPPHYDATCVGCASGFEMAGDGKTCAPKCTVAEDCHGRASAVTGNTVDGNCQCAGCVDFWSGADCGTCAGGHDRNCTRQCVALQPPPCDGFVLHATRHGPAGPLAAAVTVSAPLRAVATYVTLFAHLEGAAVGDRVAVSVVAPVGGASCVDTAAGSNCSLHVPLVAALGSAVELLLVVSRYPGTSGSVAAPEVVLSVSSPGAPGLVRTLTFGAAGLSLSPPPQLQSGGVLPHCDGEMPPPPASCSKLAVRVSPLTTEEAAAPAGWRAALVSVFAPLGAEPLQGLGVVVEADLLRTGARVAPVARQWADGSAHCASAALNLRARCEAPRVVQSATGGTLRFVLSAPVGPPPGAEGGAPHAAFFTVTASALNAPAPVTAVVMLSSAGSASLAPLDADAPPALPPGFSFPPTPAPSPTPAPVAPQGDALPSATAALYR